MASLMDERLAFRVEWFDPSAEMTRTYNLIWYMADQTLELYDIKNRRVFLKRMDYPDVKLQDLYVGSTVVVYARQLQVVDYADQFTRDRLQAKRERSLLLVLPSAQTDLGKIVSAAQKDQGIVLANLRMIKITDAQQTALGLSAEQLAPDNLVVAIELVGDDCIGRTKALAAQLSKQLGEGKVRASQDHGSAKLHLEALFAGAEASKAVATIDDNSTLVVIKPHAVAAGRSGEILDALLDEGFDITGLTMTVVSRPNAEEFFEVYKGVVPEFKGMVEQLCSGPCIAAEVRGEAVVREVRALCGPADPEVARHVFPASLRARFGKDTLTNAVHCTDLEEDGKLEVEYFFRILQDSNPETLPTTVSA